MRFDRKLIKQWSNGETLESADFQSQEERHHEIIREIWQPYNADFLQLRRHLLHFHCFHFHRFWFPFYASFDDFGTKFSPERLWFIITFITAFLPVFLSASGYVLHLHVFCESNICCSEILFLTPAFDPLNMFDGFALNPRFLLLKLQMIHYLFILFIEKQMPSFFKVKWLQKIYLISIKARHWVKKSCLCSKSPSSHNHNSF